MARKILAIDPGPTRSGIVSFHCFNEPLIIPLVLDNENLLEILKANNLEYDSVAIEMIASYGMAVGKEVFETCVWIGRFIQASEVPPVRYTRQEIKLHLCGSPRAKDANIRQALIDLYGPQGTKAKPGPTYGVKSHAWAALAVASYHHHQRWTP
jgi:hypothetical protein